MSYLTQKTIKNDVLFNGVALHSGVNVNICIKPAAPNFGIVFKRIDHKINNLVYPNFMHVTNTSLNTTIENEFGVKVSTIEHLMGALFGLSIDNALIEIDNEEVPILDGSAKDFIAKSMNTVVAVSDAPIKIIKINKEIKFTDGDRFISIQPSTLSLDIDFELKYKNQNFENKSSESNLITNANVIFNSINKSKNIMVIDKGTNEGINEEMGVISSEGVVGIIKSVTENYASIISLLNIDLKVNAILKNSSTIGSITWNGLNSKILNLAQLNR